MGPDASTSEPAGLPGAPATPSAVGNRSIERAFLVLSIVAQRPLRLGDVARRADLPKSTTSRLVASLVALGAVEVDDGLVRLGPLIPALAFGVGDQRDILRSASSTVLRALAEDVGEHAAIAINEGDDVFYLDQVMGSTSAVDSGDWSGHRHPSHGTAFGLALMAHWDDERLDRYLAAPLASFTPSTVIDPRRLRADIGAVTVDGVAWTVDQFADDVSGCAAPVTGADGEVIASIGCFAPTYRFPGDEPGGQRAVVERVLAAAAELSGTLAAVRDDVGELGDG